METTPETPPPETPGAAPPARPSRRWRILLAVFAVVLGAIGLWIWWHAGQETTDDAQVDADVVTVSARVPGQVLELAVHEGQTVREGDLLVRIDPAETTARLAQARAELASAEAAVANARAQARVTTSSATGAVEAAQAGVSGTQAAVEASVAEVAVARAAVQRAQVEVERTQRDLARLTPLEEAGAVAAADVEHARQAHDAAVAALEQSRAAVARAEEAAAQARARVAEARGRLEQTGPAEAPIEAARSAVDVAEARAAAARAAVELAELNVARTTVVAPTGGVVTNLAVEVGDLVQVGQPITALVPQDAYVVANFKETQIGLMRPGQPASVSIDAYPGLELEGRVRVIAAGTGARFSLLPPDNASGNFVKVVQRVPVRIELLDPPEGIPLRAGLSAEVTVYVDQPPVEEAEPTASNGP